MAGGVYIAIPISALVSEKEHDSSDSTETKYTSPVTDNIFSAADCVDITPAD